MAIKAFSPEMAGVGETDLEHKIVNSETAISHKEVQDYAKFIIDYLKAIKDFADEKEQTSFIIDALSDEGIIGRIDYDLFVVNDQGEMEEVLTDEEIRGVIKRIRQALFEELKGKIDDKIYFIVSDIVRNTKPNYERSVISEVVDINNNVTSIHKDQLISKKYRDAFVAGHLMFEKLNPHPNIVKMKEYDPVSHQTIYEKIDFIPLNKYLQHENDAEKKFISSLLVMRDCLKGAKYLADKGLVLQDIHPSNFGLVETDKGVKGVLFDLEGLTKEGEKLDRRLGHKGQYRSTSLLDWNQPTAVSFYEMVYQFGCSLRDMIGDYISLRPTPNFDIYKIIKNLQILSSDMIKQCPFNEKKFKEGRDPSSYTNEDLKHFAKSFGEGRINLREAEERLEKIISEIENEKVLV